MVNVGITYLIWVLGFCFTPCPGIYRFYMRKFNVGTVFRCIPGIGHILAIVDLVRIPSQVSEINLKIKYKKLLALSQAGVVVSTKSLPAKKTEKESVELIILKTAKKNHGIVSPGEVALEGRLAIEDATNALDKLAKKGYAELQIKRSGVVVYTFPEFMDEDNHDKFVEF